MVWTSSAIGINPPFQDDDTVEITGIKVYPSYEFKLTYLTVDNTWRSTSINHIRDIVNQEIKKLYE